MEPLESRIQYTFRRPALLTEALTHASLRYETKRNAPDNQRLEFLGDAVLQLVLTEEIYHRLPDCDEGVMTQVRTRIVSSRPLAKLARSLHLGEYINMGKAEELNGGRTRESTLVDAIEALFGAIYLDSSMQEARVVIMKLLQSELTSVLASRDEVNPKGKLQEILQGLGVVAPVYELIDSHGPDHQKHFECAAVCGGRELGRGEGPNKKEAEMEAAKNALIGDTLKQLLRELQTSA